MATKPSQCFQQIGLPVMRGLLRPVIRQGGATERLNLALPAALQSSSRNVQLNVQHQCIEVRFSRRHFRVASRVFEESLPMPLGERLNWKLKRGKAATLSHMQLHLAQVLNTVNDRHKPATTESA